MCSSRSVHAMLHNDITFFANNDTRLAGEASDQSALRTTTLANQNSPTPS